MRRHHMNEEIRSASATRKPAKRVTLKEAMALAGLNERAKSTRLAGK